MFKISTRSILYYSGEYQPQSHCRKEPETGRHCGDASSDASWPEKFCDQCDGKKSLFSQNRFLDILFHFHKWNLQKMEAPLLGKIPKKEKYFID